jgi:hypothetical protein
MATLFGYTAIDFFRLFGDISVDTAFLLLPLIAMVVAVIPIIPFFALALRATGLKRTVFFLLAFVSMFGLLKVVAPFFNVLEHFSQCETTTSKVETTNPYLMGKEVAITVCKTRATIDSDFSEPYVAKIELTKVVD